MRILRRYRTWLADSGRWDGFEFRPGDIVISTPAKCGTTWLQMICALLIFGVPDLPGALTELSPWLDIQTESVSNVFAALAAQRHQRFIKTHTPLDGLPFDERVTYICVGRDPRDVAISSGHHLDNMNREVLRSACEAAMDLDAPRSVVPDQTPENRTPEDRTPEDQAPEPVTDPVDRFWRWIDEAPPNEGLELTLHHLATFWNRRHESNVLLFHYDDLQADLEREMRLLAGRLGIAIDEGVWPALVAAASFDQMRDRADTVAPQVRMAGLWPDARRFFNRGVSRQWRALLGDPDLDRYWARVRRLATPDLATWIHRGWRRGTGPPVGRPSPDTGRAPTDHGRRLTSPVW